MDYYIRRVEERDLVGLVEILTHEVLNDVNNFDFDPPQLDTIAKKWKLGSEKYPWLVAVDPNENDFVLGFAMSGVYRDKQAYQWTTESTVYIRPEYHRKGIAKALYHELLVRLRALGLHTVIACITVSNEVSIKFHESLGFQKTGEIPMAGFKFDKWHSIGFWIKILEVEVK